MWEVRSKIQRTPKGIRRLVVTAYTPNEIIWIEDKLTGMDYHISCDADGYKLLRDATDEELIKLLDIKEGN